ncbi:probable G-protein coupled receptor 34 [Hydra vulgaris]|uniref:probable G-protein coupled receptor 34 n=1 Tax=Hydra vulgaris TaxID=6087 RepID=UPI000640EE82|nr:probable G-protein coupled receptor 34 [Hydra vulgaris]XP_012557500.1 probable G-protein coupled receptor 34 [Hydra vulgaris]XP_012557501.1 probable G-protein coupled receptor 34 [Hydra vulgaris]XP_047136233.1 probable G-protein coupled receptor 34 [Hydra vulgaris]XP_047136234.1 probable G-protein coupled receptor 34 [Hydra vulgaris]
MKTLENISNYKVSQVNSFIKHRDSFHSANIFVLFGLALVFFVGVIGNIIVLYVFAWKKRQSRSRFETLLVPLALIDLLTSFITPIIFTYGTLTNYRRWDFGQFGCKVLSSFFPVSITLSQSILVFISYERYKVVISPFYRSFKKILIRFWILLTILISLILVSPYTDSLEIVIDTGYDIYTCIPNSNKHYQLYFYSVGNTLRDFLATVAMVYFGYKTNQYIQSNIKTITDRRHKFKRIICAIKARKMLVVVVCCFSFCVFPLDLFQAITYTLYITKTIQNVKSYNLLLQANTYLTVLQVANSALNIIIYSQMHNDFRRARCCRVRRKNPQYIGIRLRSKTSESMINNEIDFVKVINELKT